MTSRYVVREAETSDADGLLRLAMLAGHGFTSLKPNATFLANAIAASKRWHFRTEREEAGRLLLVLEDIHSKQIVGTAGLKQRSRRSGDIYDLRCIDEGGAIAASAKDTMFLEPAPLFSDDIEVGTFVLDPVLRKTGIGSLLGRSRYACIDLMRTSPETYVVAELRGRSDQVGSSPFYDAFCGSLLPWNFEEADLIVAMHGFTPIAPFLPKNRFCVSDLSDAAREAIGETHSSGQGALELLRRENFAFAGAVDLFDGGPIMRVKAGELMMSRTSCQRTITVKPASDSAAPWIVASLTEKTGFIAIIGHVGEQDTTDAVGVSEIQSERLGVSPGTDVYAAPLRLGGTT